jgi:hypothetical protein
LLTAGHLLPQGVGRDVDRLLPRTLDVHDLRNNVQILSQMYGSSRSPPISALRASAQNLLTLSNTAFSRGSGSLIRRF